MIKSNKEAIRDGTKKSEKVTHIDNVRLSDDGKSVVIIDQTQLPNRTEYLTLSTGKDIWDAIYKLQVRGAPAIGICAGYGIYCLALQIETEDYDQLARSIPRAEGVSEFFQTDRSELKLGTEPYGGCGKGKCRQAGQRDSRPSGKRMQSDPRRRY